MAVEGKSSVRGRPGRIARNEVRFRDINERLEANLRALGHDPEPQEFVCECGNMDCRQTVRLTFDEYEAVRRHGRRFIIMRGHEIPDVENVVERNDRYAVAEKHERTAPIAEGEDPRAAYWPTRTARSPTGGSRPRR
jgi:hypothetical protein